MPQEEGYPIVNAKDIPSGRIDLATCTRISRKDWETLKDQNCAPREGDILLSKDGTIGRVVHCEHDPGAVVLSSIAILRPSKAISPGYLAHALRSDIFRRQLLVLESGSAVRRIVLRDIKRLEFAFPKKPEQAKIAEILSTVDRAIEQTEALIAKQRRIKTGLMHDLLTRGIDEHGNLRSEQTHQFKDSPLGRIPVEWDVTNFGGVVESAVDGPFGSNLKSDHYVDEPGVRVVRLGNIGVGEFLNRDKAWISVEHGTSLARHSVEPFDLLIASLGDDKHPFGRACLYTDTDHSAVVKADVFRVRCKQDRLIHLFAVQMFNFPRWRQGLYALAQGVTRDRVNLTNMMRLPLPIPALHEQASVAQIAGALSSEEGTATFALEKLRDLKSGLMQDLLTGRKRVTQLLRH